jgi:hypothetical protein
VPLRLLVLTLVLSIATLAHAQAPPSSFFDGRGPDDLRALASDPHNDILLRRGAASRLVIALADAGDLDAADDAARAFAKNIDPLAVKHAKAVRRRSGVNVASLAVLGVALGVALLGVVSGGGASPRALAAVGRAAPFLAVYLAWVGLVGGYLASTYENGSPAPFLLFALVMGPLVVLLRVWSAVGSRSLAARVGRGVTAAVATFAVAFLVVEHVNVSYLEGFGL